MKISDPPEARFIASLWTLIGHPSPSREWSLERKIKAIKEAGFDGFGSLLTPEHRRLAEKYELMVIGFLVSDHSDKIRKMLHENKENGAHYINVHIGNDGTSLSEALKLTLGLMEDAAELGLEPSIETHRNTCTETPEKAYALADAYHKATGKLLPMTFDCSHHGVVKHLEPSQFIERLLVRPKLIQRSQLAQFRPFNGQHAQVPVTDGNGKITQEFKNWLPLVDAYLKIWRQGKQAGRELFIYPELGPVASGYNLHSLPNSWAEAKVLTEILRKHWKASENVSK